MNGPTLKQSLDVSKQCSMCDYKRGFISSCLFKCKPQHRVEYLSDRQYRPSVRAIHVSFALVLRASYRQESQCRFTQSEDNGLQESVSVVVASFGLERSTDKLHYETRHGNQKKPDHDQAVKNPAFLMDLGSFPRSSLYQAMHLTPSHSDPQLSVANATTGRARRAVPVL